MLGKQKQNLNGIVQMNYDCKLKGGARDLISDQPNNGMNQL